MRWNVIEAEWCRDNLIRLYRRGERGRKYVMCLDHSRFASLTGLSFDNVRGYKIRFAIAEVKNFACICPYFSRNRSIAKEGRYALASRTAQQTMRSAGRKGKTIAVRV